MRLRALVAAPFRLASAWTVLALLALVFSQGVAAQQPDVLPPATNVCPSGGTVGDVGSTPTTPGHWYDRDKYGTGWHLMYHGDNSAMTVFWYSYDSNGRPTWLMSGSPTLNLVSYTWQAPLYRVTWNYETNSSNGGVRVGSVAISFLPGDPTRAALRWQWDEAGPSSYQECIRDFSRKGPSDLQMMQTMGVGAGFNGNWYEPTLSGWGAFLNIAQLADSSPAEYAETTGLAIYDDNGQPVWLSGLGPVRPTAPEIGVEESHSLGYFKAGAGYPQGVPTSVCQSSSGNCSVFYGDIGTWSRIFISPLRASARLITTGTSSKLPAGVPTITRFKRPDSGTGWVDLWKLTSATQIVADRTWCQVPAVGGTCPISINWSADPGAYPSATVFRLDMDTGVRVQVGAGTYGELVEPLAAGARVLYELRATNAVSSTLLSKTFEIKALLGPSAFQVQLSSQNKLVASVVDAPETASATLRFAPGQIRFQTRVDGPMDEQWPFNEWLDPENPTEAASYEVMAQLVSGALYSGALNQWLGLGISRDWTLIRTSSGTSEAVLNLQIRRIGTTTVLASTHVTLRATQVGNQLPSVALTAPTSGSTYQAPATLALAASAGDVDGTVSRVDFYSGGNVIGSDTTAPYTFDWTDVGTGSYSLKARAYDNRGGWTDSAVVGVSVTAPPVVVPTADAISDSVGATVGQFRVDESGAATYQVPIYTPPGRAGVAPQMALSYSSQGGNGPMGKGWAISGTSSVSRCRATREHGDFIVGGVPVDGDPGPVNFTTSDKFCLDGQRLIPAPAAAAACKTLSGFTAVQLRTELESFQRVCAYSVTASLANGPRFFTVERKDGSTSWYGDRATLATGPTGPRADGVVDANGNGQAGKVVSWAQTRFQDSTGNYIDYLYLKDPAGGGYPGEQVLAEVQYTGKVVLSGQTGGAQAPFAKILFNYASLPANDFSVGYQSGSRFWQTVSLQSVSVVNDGTTVRHYPLTYGVSVSGSNARTLTQLQECSDATNTVCYAPTVFNWSVAQNAFQTWDELPQGQFGNMERFEGFKLGDVDGDGRQDLVRLRDGHLGEACERENVHVGFGKLDGSGRPIFEEPSQTTICTPTELVDKLGDDSWMLFDYDGDGRDDLLVAGPLGGSWQLYRSLGRPASSGKVFDNSTNLLAGLSPQIPGTGSKEMLLQLADLNGDGLLDVVYPRDDALRARLMTRAGQSFGWGPELLVNIDPALYDDCREGVLCMVTTPKLNRKNGGIQLLDFNADSRSDLLFDITKRFSSGCTPQVLTTGGAILSSSATPTLHASPLLEEGSCGLTTAEKYVVALSVSSITATTVNLMTSATWNTESEQPPYTVIRQADQKYADLNGDGLTDVVFRSGMKTWNYAINVGAGFLASQSLGDLTTEGLQEYLQVVDINGDGRTDLVYPKNDFVTFKVRYALPAGGFAPEVNVPGGQALINCTDNCLTRNSYLFNDFDADGAIDFLKIKWSTEGGDGVYRFTSSRANAASRFQPRDSIVQITNGLGAITHIVQLPMSLLEVYDPHSGSRNTLNYGRGSAIQDLLAPMYVVAAARSSAPTAENPAATAAVYYRYAGAKVQSGGRGLLGFQSISTIDSNHGDGHVVTTTQYNQDAPFAGTPAQTVKRLVSGLYQPGPCYTTISDNCFAALGAEHPAIGGILLSHSTNVWEASPAFAAGVQQPLHVRIAGTTEQVFDPANGARTSKVNTTFVHDGMGNVLQTAVDTFTGTSETAPISVTTVNTYQDDAAAWRLGRLKTSTVSHTRGGAPVVRATSFDYAMTGAVTGLLTAERIQPSGGADQSLKKLYVLDAYGNRTSAHVCSTSVTDNTCRSMANLPFRPTNTTIRRYSRHEYDGNGRYLTATYEPFWNGSAATEVATQQVLGRDSFGEPTAVEGLNGSYSVAKRGAMGRNFWAWARTKPGAAVGEQGGGVASVTTYRNCSGPQAVNCPANARFREKVVTTGAPTKFTYFDILGRPLLSVAESFSAGVAQRDFAGTCTTYDLMGKPNRVSNPFFLDDAAVSGEPVFSTNPCALNGRAWNESVFDVVGRPTFVFAADGSQTRMVYNGLVTTTTNAANQSKTEEKNGAGELVRVTDAAGLATNYTYDQAGNLASVWRDAGRGVIATTMTYDALGRKVTQSDPDAGNWSYAYNALGEQVSQTHADGARTTSLYDARGRVFERKTFKGSTTETTTTTVHDTASNGLGQVATEAITGTYAGWVGDKSLGTALSQSRAASYDTLGRTAATATLIDGVSYTTTAIYDGLGRVQRSQDVSGEWVKTEYTARGFAVRVCASDATDPSSTCPSGSPTTYVETQEVDARGNVTLERRVGNNALSVKRYFDPWAGRPTQLCVGQAAGGCALINEQYGWSTIGNLEFRDKGAYREEFSYDSLNRLKEARYARVGGVTYTGTNRPISTALSYDALGNICSKTINGVSQAYTYAGAAGCGLGGLPGSGGANGSASPHQVSAVAGLGTTYAYDARGNQTLADITVPLGDRFIRYTAADQAHEIAKGGSQASPSARTRFWYGADGSRYKREDIGPGISGIRRTLYLGNVEIVTESGVNTTKRTIAGVVLQERKSGLVTDQVLFHDHLGSLVRITSTSGSVIAGLDFAAFGERRTFTDPRNYGIPPPQTTRGFTGHEHVDAFDVVHMNGRIYDAKLGRFLQADPIVQDPSNGQNYNRYTYVWNNPLAFTDPSGYSSKALQYLGAAISIIAAVITQQYWALKEIGAAFATALAGGFVSGVVASGGSLKSGLIGAFSAAATLGIGLGNLGGVGEFVARGAVQGTVEVLQGGKFGHGFAAAAVFALAAPGLGRIGNPVGRVVASAVVGGAASRITGGKFANGALMSAFSAAIGQVAQGAFRKGQGGSSATAAARGLTEGEVDLVQEYYGESVPYEEIRVKLKPGGDYTARTIGSKITYRDANFYSTDFSTATPQQQSVFLHEVMHVWQNANIRSYTALAAGSEHLRFDDPYAYQFDASRALSSYRYEQQGQIMEDYAFARMTGAGTIGGVPIQSYDRMIYETVTNIYRSP